MVEWSCVDGRVESHRETAMTRMSATQARQLPFCLFVLTLGLLAVHPIGAAIYQDESSFNIDFEVVRLENDLTVILSEDHSAPTFSIAMVYDVGSRNEAPGKTGFAHLFEHMMFQGSENVGRGEHADLVEINGGGLGGVASVDQTHFYQTLPANQLDLALFLEADRMQSLDISQTNLDAQRAVIREERRTLYENLPYGLTDEKVTEAVYDSFEYGHAPVGPMDDLDSATLEDVRDFYAVYFAPNNAVLALVGDFESAEARTRIEHYFGDIPSGSDPPGVVVNEPPQNAERRTSFDDQLAQLPRLDIAYRVPPGNTPQWYVLAVMGDILAAPGTGRLHRMLIDDAGLAVAVGGGIDERRGNSMFRISAIPVPGTPVEELESIIVEAIETLRVELVEEVELEIVRTKLELAEAESARSTLSRAISLATNMVFYNDPDVINRTGDMLSGITPESLLGTTNLYLRETNRTVVVTLPTGERNVIGGPRL